jgi:hypothetical protein
VQYSESQPILHSLNERELNNEIVKNSVKSKNVTPKVNDGEDQKVSNRELSSDQPKAFFLDLFKRHREMSSTKELNRDLSLRQLDAYRQRRREIAEFVAAEEIQRNSLISFRSPSMVSNRGAPGRNLRQRTRRLDRQKSKDCKVDVDDMGVVLHERMDLSSSPHKGVKKGKKKDLLHKMSAPNYFKANDLQGLLKTELGEKY